MQKRGSKQKEGRKESRKRKERETERKRKTFFFSAAGGLEEGVADELRC